MSDTDEITLETFVIRCALLSSADLVLYANDIKRVQEEYRNLRSLLAEAERIMADIAENEDEPCPACSSFESSAHFPDCAIDAWLHGYKSGKGTE